MTNIGDIIQPGEAIPEDVTELADRPPRSGWARWVRHDSQDRWDWLMNPERASEWRVRDQVGGRSSAGLVKEAQDEDWAPFRVLAVREPEPAEHPVLALVKHYGAAQYTVGYQTASLDHSKADLVGAEGLELLAQIEAALTAPPTVLSLPVVSPEAVALAGMKSGIRWTRNGERWVSPEGFEHSLSFVLKLEGTVTVEYAPEPEPTLAEDVETVRGALEAADALTALHRIETALTKDGAA